MKKMKKTRPVAMTTQIKATAKERSLKSALASFKIENIEFSPKQITSVKSQLRLGK